MSLISLGQLAATPRVARTTVYGQLAAALEADGVRYCQWKGYAKRSRWASGEGDVDLLVDRTMAARFARILEGLDFRLALNAGHRQVPGVVSFIGHDPTMRRLLHIHAHYHLVVGPGWARHYHLPLEQLVLDHTVPREWFRSPIAELELLLLVLHSTLRHGVQDLVRGDPYWHRALQPGLDDLEARSNPAALAAVLHQHLPDVSPELFARCWATLRPDSPPAARLAARVILERRLTAHAFRAPAAATMRLHAARLARFAGLGGAWLREPGKRLATGGSVIALVGADGAGKSTCAGALVRWLSPQFETRWTHLGRPPRSLPTCAAGLVLKFVRAIGAPLRAAGLGGLLPLATLLRTAATARDRLRLYRRMRRDAAAGALVICERYPVPESYALAGPAAAQGIATESRGPIAEWLRRIDADCYRQIARPDVLLVLAVDPDVAVERKTDEPAPYVRARAELLRDVAWPAPAAHIVDATQPLPAVVADLRQRLWAAL